MTLPCFGKEYNSVARECSVCDDVEECQRLCHGKKEAIFKAENQLQVVLSLIPEQGILRKDIQNLYGHNPSFLLRRLRQMGLVRVKIEKRDWYYYKVP